MFLLNTHIGNSDVVFEGKFVEGQEKYRTYLYPQHSLCWPARRQTSTSRQIVCVCFEQKGLDEVDQGTCI